MADGVNAKPPTFCAILSDGAGSGVYATPGREALDALGLAGGEVELAHLWLIPDSGHLEYTAPPTDG